MERRKRLPDGTFGPPETLGSTVALKEQIASLGMQLAQEKLSNIQKDAIINGLGAQVAQLKLEIIQLKGSGI